MQNVVFLIIITDFNICAKVNGSRVGWQQFIDNFKQRRFACAVVTNNCNVFTAFYLKGYIFKKKQVVKTFGQSLYTHDVISAGAVRRKG